MKKFVIVFILVCIIGGMVFLFLPRSARESRSEILMGTVCEITLVEKSSERRIKAFDDAFRIIRNVEQRMSIFSSESEVSEVNHSAATRPVYVSSDLIFLIEKSAHFSKMTDGAFDITALPLSRLWGFVAGEKRVPSEEEINDCLGAIGYENVVTGIDEKGKAFVTLRKKGVQIDLGGVAKGYACDLVVTSLRRNGIRHGMVNIGGTIYALGRPSKDTYRKVGIRNPRDKKGMSDTVFLHDEAIATSGDYEQYFIDNGKRYTHLLDPRTGYPVRNVISVSVRTSSAMVADILSTSFFVLGEAEGMKLAKKLSEIEAYFIYIDGEKIRTIGTESFTGQ